MNKIYINPEEDLFEILEHILRGMENDVEVMIDTKNPILSNSLNLKYLETESAKAGKRVIFVPKDEKGKELIDNFYKQNASGVVDKNETDSDVVDKNESSSGFVQGDILEHDNEVVQEALPRKKLSLLGIFTSKKFSKKPQLMYKIITVGLLLLIPIGLFVVWWFLPTANITLTLKSDSLDQAFTLKVSADVKEPDLKAGVFPAELISTQKTLTQTADATGTKTVGEKAEGVVTISNKTKEDKTFPQGTLIELISEDTLQKIQFTTKEETTIVGSTEGTVGKADVAIVASDIGEDYNLEAGQLFSVGGLDSANFVAKNKNAITGGVSKTVKVVTQSDQDKLYENVKSQLNKQVKEALAKKAEGKNLAQNSVKITELSKTFSDNVGAEVSNFSLELSEKAEGLVIDENIIKKLEQNITPEVPEGYKVLDDKGEFAFDVIDSEGSPKIIIRYKAKIGKVIETDNLKGELLGQSIAKAQEKLKSIKNMSEYSIRITPKLPPALTRMPRQKSRININVEYK